ncbi:MAG: hypothetical protein KJ615_09915, partial [Bacteroidetes bacterium]|nr:hypothetical protein [Bacteroidota bacterium]
MKNLKQNLILVVILLFVQYAAFPQMYGSWIVPAGYHGTSTSDAYQLNFTELGITEDALVSLINSNQVISAGAYNENYDRVFYVIDNLFYDDFNTPQEWPRYNDGFMPEFQIIPCPGHSDKYIMVTMKGSYHEYNTFAYYNVTVNESDEFVISDEIEISNFDFTYGGFSIANEYNNSRHLYAIIQGQDGNGQAGLYRYLITASGVSDETLLFSSLDTELSDEDFDAYNFEITTNANGNAYAWIDGEYGSDLNNDEIITINGNTTQVFSLNYGRIGGIEFSKFEENILYASCTERGIVKLNFV